MNANTIKPRSVWPYAIISSFIMLAVFDAYIVTRAIQTSTGLVTIRPYDDGLQYQKKINAAAAASLAGIKMSLVQKEGVLSFNFSNIVDKPAILMLRLIKPDNDKYDRAFELKSSSGKFLLDRGNIQSGLWFIEADMYFEENPSKSYLFESKEMLE